MPVLCNSKGRLRIAAQQPAKAAAVLHHGLIQLRQMDI